VRGVAFLGATFFLGLARFLTVTFFFFAATFLFGAAFLVVDFFLVADDRLVALRADEALLVEEAFLVVFFAVGLKCLLDDANALWVETEKARLRATMMLSRTKRLGMALEKRVKALGRVRTLRRTLCMTKSTIVEV
jgi:hypothetical protein